MAAFTPDLAQLEQQYRENGADLFALCYLQGGRPAAALDLMAAALCDIAASPKLWALALSGREGFLRAGYLNCQDASLRRPKRRKKKKGSPLGDAPRTVLPFSLTEPLRKILKLRLPLGCALLCFHRWGLTGEGAAQVLGCSPVRASRLEAAALKKAGVSAAQAKANLCAMAPAQDSLDKVWQEFLSQRGEAGFAARQRFRRARRLMDNLVPYLAMAAVALCVVAFLGVENGWFGTQDLPHQALESQAGDSAGETAPWVGDVSVFVPEEGGFAEYVVHNTPGELSEVVRQMVYLGGAPQGTTLLSTNLDNHGTQSTEGSVVTYTMGDTLTLTVELSREAAALSGEEGERMLQAMAATFAGYISQEPDELFIRCDGQELAVNGKTAQDFLGGQLPVTRTVETDYRE